MTEIDSYRRWLVGGRTDRAIVETIEVNHVSFSAVYLANWDVPIERTLVDKSNTLQEFIPTRFGLASPELSTGTVQTTTLAISAFDGIIYDALRKMTVAQRRDSPITITPRLFYHNIDSQVITNPPVWNVQSITLSLEAVTAELSVLPLRIHRTGIYYTTVNFPVLRFYA